MGGLTGNILIIGGSYFAGRMCAESLASDPANRVFVVNRGNRPLCQPNIKEIVCDRHSPHLKKALPRIPWRAVIDFCAYTPLDVIQLMLAVPQDAVSHYIFLSTASVYADTLDLPLCEDAPKLLAPQPNLGAASDYGYNKRMAEEKVVELCRPSGIPFTLLRPAIIYGKYNYAPRESWFFDRIAAKQAIALPANPLALYQFVSVWDVSRAVTSCLENSAALNAAFNLAAEELISYRRLVQVLEEVMGTKAGIYVMDSKEIDAQQIPLPFPLERHLIYSGRKIEKALGFSYMPFAEGMKKTWAWYAGHGRKEHHG